MLITCANPTGGSGDTGTITISIGSSAARASWMPPGVTNLNVLDHTITIVDSTGLTQEKDKIKADGSSVSFTVATGSCQINAKAYLNGAVVAEGFANPVIKAGSNPVPIQMGPPVFNVSIVMIGNVSGDSITVTPAKGVQGDVVTLNYTLANTKNYNQIDFSGIGSAIAPVTAGTNGTRSYTIAPGDAINSAITITAAFTHSDLIPDPISFITNATIIKSYGDGPFTNRIDTSGTSGPKGSGAITFSSSNPSIATVDGTSGTVTIIKAGGPVTITAEKAADAVYAGAITTYQLEINKATVIVTPGPPSRTLIPFDSVDPDYGTTSTILITVSGLAGSDTITVGVGNSYGLSGSKTGVTNGSNSSTNDLSITYNGTTTVSSTAQTVGLSITLPNNENYTLSGSPTVSVNIHDGQAASKAILITSANWSAFGNYVRTATGLTRHYKLTTDITLTGSAGSWVPIGGGDSPSFTGSFDGGGKTINLGTNIVGKTVSPNFDMIGLFGQIDGVVKNLRLTGSISFTGSIINTSVWVGALAGQNIDRGTIFNVSSSVGITVSVDKQPQAGGIVGNNIGSIKNCYSTGDCTASTSSGTANTYVGGIAGFNSNGGRIENSWASGIITGNAPILGIYVGGIAGINSYSSYIPTTIGYCVALNTKLTDSGSGNYIGRIAFNFNDSVFTNNYGNTNMTGRTWTSEINGQDGMSVAIPTTEDWWKNTAGWSNVWGNPEASPWTWNSTNNRPKLWFE